MLHKNTNKYIFVSYTSRGPKIKQLYGPCNYYLKTIPYVRVVNIRQKWLIFSVLNSVYVIYLTNLFLTCPMDLPLCIKRWRYIKGCKVFNQLCSNYQ